MKMHFRRFVFRVTPVSSISRKRNRMGRMASAAILAVCLFAGTIPCTEAADVAGYSALDPSQPVSFDGKTVRWNGRTFILDETTLFLDQRLKPEQIAGNPYAFNTLKDAAAKLKHGTAGKPMMLLTAPGVYWVDDPDDPAIRGGTNGGAPYGMTIACNHLYFYGLNTRRENVVFAVNRGQTQGSEGNFTMFNIQGTGLKSENVTFGNYCNVDLEFPLNPSLGRPKRAEAIAQAQLFAYSGNDGVAINSGFVSRLNLLPFAMTYINCHIESSGHASRRSSVYVGCTLEFYGFNYSSGKFLNCDIYLKPAPAGFRGRSTYHFGFTDGTGAGGVAVDTRFHRSQELVDANISAEISWDRVPQAATTRGYQHNVTLDGKPYVIQETATPGVTIVMAADAELLKAFKVTHGGQTYYNVPNVNPGVDPLGHSTAIKAAAVAAGKDETHYLSIPISATLRTAPGAPTTIRSGQTTATLMYAVAPAAHASGTTLGRWAFKASAPGVVQLIPGADNTVTVAGTNHGAGPVVVTITATNELGLEACTRLTVEPAFVAPPTFARAPVIGAPAGGRVTLGYQLDLGGSQRADESLITWYRCTDAQGANPLKVAVSRRNRPETAYTLSEGDVGHYLMATIQPKHGLSEAGPAQTVYARTVVTKEDVKIHAIDTDFQNFPTDPQPRIIPGTWTLDGYFAPEAVTETKTPRYTANPNSWTYGPGQSNHHGLDETARGARLFYTPAGGRHGDMTVRAKFAPDKNTGQGFGSATDQFLEVYIKYDLATRTGYGLRIQRLTTDEINAIGYKGAGAVAGCVFFLVKYTDGAVTSVGRKVMSSAFIAECTVELTVRNGRLQASVTSTEKVRSGDAFDYPREVRFDEPIDANAFGGTGMLFTGTVGVNSVLVTGWHTSWSQ